jgi:hypothetical protein
VIFICDFFEIIGVEFNGRHVIVSSRAMGIDVEKVIETVTSNNSVMLNHTSKVCEMIGIDQNIVRNHSVVAGIDKVIIFLLYVFYLCAYNSLYMLEHIFIIMYHTICR